MKAILFIGHGTRSKKGAQEALSFIKRVMERIDTPIQEVSFLELTEPSIEQGFQNCIERGATEITIVPLFLLAAGHIKQDIPEALAPLREKYPQILVKMTDPFGVQDEILTAISELIRDKVEHLNENDRVLIVGRGSSDPSIHEAFAEIAKGIRKRLKVEKVSVCYLAATEPRLQEGLEVISHQAKSRVIVIPYLLFSGLLLAEIEQSVRKRQKLGEEIIQIGPLTRHRVIEDIVIRRADKEEPDHEGADD